MPTYIVPQVLVHQDFQVAPQAQDNPLRAHITGPHAQLVRFSDDDEQELGELGYYDNLNATAYDWPNRQAGGQVDQSYTKLYMKNALLQYFSDSVGGGSTITKTAGYKNRIRSSTVNFAENGVDYPRAADLLDRDVQLGDVAKVRFVPGGGDDPVTLWTYVKGIIGDAVASDIDTPTLDPDNAATDLVAAATATQIRGPWNAVVCAADATNYDAYPTGVVTETYTVIVTESSSGGDFTTARLRIISASGRDDVASVTPALENNLFEIGTHGARIKFTTDSGATTESESASEQGVSPNDLIVGQRWTVTVGKAFTATAAPTEGGTYTGTVDTTYIVTVTTGGSFATGSPMISVSTTHGVDISGPTLVSAAGVAVPIGTKGVTLTFAGNGLAYGDKFYVVVTAAGEGPMRTLVLGNNIPEEIVDGTECDLTLFIRKPVLQISKNRTGFAPLTNFDQTETQITVNDGIIAYDESWTDGGVPVALDVAAGVAAKQYGRLYVEYRAWIQGLCNEVGTISDVGEINDLISGALTPDNPLKWGVFKALENAGGVEVKYSAVCDPEDDDSWLNVLEMLLGRDDVYGLVPLTKKRLIQDAWAAHVKDQSSPVQGLWRVAWFNLHGVPEIPIVHAGSDIDGYTTATTTDGEVCRCVVEDDPESTNTQYTIVRCPDANGNFLTNEVRAGDIVRLLYTGDGFGNYTYQEFVVDEVQSEDQIRLLAGPAAPINTAAKIEIWRNLTPTEESAEIAKQAGAWSDRRVRAVWPDQIETSGTIQEGYHLCAALAGLRSGVVPHQGLTNIEVLGFTTVNRTTKKFNKPQLNTMAVAGVWIVTQDRFDGAIFTRHAVTTGQYEDINMREEMVTSNVDSISYRFKDHFAPYIGVTNVTPSMIELLRLEVQSLIEVLKTEKFSRQLGGQLIDATIRELRPHALLKDRIVLILDTVIPYPFNNFEIHLVI